MEAAVMTPPTATRNQKSNNEVGERIELGRYRTAAGVERVLYGQRVATVVRFLPGSNGVLVQPRRGNESVACRSRGVLSALTRPDAARRKRRNRRRGTGVVDTWEGS
jgi:hypothetical protein